MSLKRLFASFALTVSSMFGLAAEAATIGPTYDPPVAYSWSGSGISAGHAGGKTWEFTGVNTASFTNLFWGVGTVESAMDGSIDSPGETLTFQSAIGSVATWTGITSVDISNVGAVGILTRFTATIISGASNWTNAAGVGVTDTTYPVVGALTGPSLTVNLLFEASADGGATFFAQNALYDSLSTISGGQSRTGFYSGFFYEPASVPVPASLPLLFAGLGVLGFLRRRKQKSA